MANNRMYLVHKPSGLALCLGKTMMQGWYDAPERGSIQRFYRRIGFYEQDKLELLFEDDGGWHIEGRDGEFLTARFDEPD